MRLTAAPAPARQPPRRHGSSQSTPALRFDHNLTNACDAGRREPLAVPGWLATRSREMVCSGFHGYFFTTA
jgi:hypothetical protein